MEETKIQSINYKLYAHVHHLYQQPENGTVV